MREAGFRHTPPRALPEGGFGPPAPVLWDWRAPRKADGDEKRRKGTQERKIAPKGPRKPHAKPHPAPRPVEPRPGNAFAALADLLR
jgi:ATP-dependent RNA helicase SUPV3L1/SUV3